MRGVVEVADVDEPDQDTDSCDDLGELVAKVVQLLLERRRLRDLRRDALVDISNRRVGTGQDDQRNRMARDDGCAREQHVDLVLLDGIRILDHAGVLGHRLALARQDGLVDVEAVALDRQDPAVGGDPVADGDGDDIAGDQLVGLDARNVSVAHDLCLVGRVFLERGDGLFGAGLLRDADDGVEDEDGEDLAGLGVSSAAGPSSCMRAGKLTTAGSTNAVQPSSFSNSASTNETAAEPSRMMTSWSLNCSRMSSQMGVGGSSGSAVSLH